MNAIKVEIKVIPNAPRNQVQGLADGVWKIKIAAPPDKGKANQELISFLADKLGLRRADIELVRGAASRHKILAISGVSQESLQALLCVPPKGT